MALATFHYHSKRFARAKRAQTIQHAFAALALITAALAHLREPGAHHSIVLPVAELVTAAVLIGFIVREKIHRHRGHVAHGAIGWVEIAGAAMTFVEALSKLQQRHHTLFYVLSFVNPVLLLLFGIFDVQLTSFRRFTADDDALLQHAHFFHFAKPRRWAWTSMKTFRVADDAIEVRDAAGATARIKLRDVVERDEALAWFRAQFAARGIAEG